MKVNAMLRTATAALVLSFAAGAAAAASVRVLDTACVRSPVAAVAPGLGGKICTRGTLGTDSGPVMPAAHSDVHRLGRGPSLAVDAEATFVGSPHFGVARAAPPAHAMKRAPVSTGQGRGNGISPAAPGNPPFVAPGVGPGAALPPGAAIPPIFDPITRPKHANDAEPIDAVPITIPLPASGWLMLGVFGALALVRRRRVVA
ncbi:VPLPA-CTERM sorting domain-containing protein [Pararhodobacter sp. SW119]|uniref:VPLPA-CTERM sorting domain-containing protein n=1 Tax=Pararhodobacter sp. SW119 TaxID=2780075 RepID=UPI001ADF6D00